jgi:subtilisin family serine protease
MAIRAGQQSGAFNVLDIVDGINYAYMMKADVINMSYGGYFSSQLEKEALEFAFSEAALIGAAGNDSYTNRPHPLGKNFYPASYTFVVGVMATAPDRNFSFFTNVDFEPYDTQEYEVMAPGSGILSTIPNNKYASWNGTSMAAPVVSGVAALLRSYFTDRMSYSNRFIMSQIIGTGNEVWIPGALRALISPKWENYTEVDAYKALTTNPIPKTAAANPARVENFITFLTFGRSATLLS